VGFLYPEMETLGIQYLSSVLKIRGHETKLFFDPQLFDDTITRNKLLKLKFDYKDKLISEIEEFRPDVIVFSVLSTTCEWAFYLSQTIKAKMDIPIVFGGIHPTLVPEEVMRNSFIDYAIVGEGEYALLELVESGFDKDKILEIKNVCYKKDDALVCNPLRAPIADLDTLPFPDKELFYEKMPYLKKSYTIVTGRGCPHGCTYCCNGYLNKIYNRGYLRRRSAENVIAELDWAVKKYGINHVYFDDSTFTYDRNWLSNFAVHYKKRIGLPCFCWVYPTDVDDDLIGIFRSLNCRAVEMGVESLDERVRKDIFGRVYSNSDVENALKLFKKNRIFCVVDNIKGFCDDPEKEVKDLVEFYNENRPNKIYIFEHRGFPKTEILNLIKNKNSGKQLLPFTIATEITNKKIRQLELLLVFIYFLPRNVVKYLLRKKIYRIFPPLGSYNILEIFPYFVNFFKPKKYRFWYPVRGTRHRYVHYFIHNPGYFLKRLLLSWG